jgi:hypothetical protein
VTKVNIDMMRSARERFAAEPEVDGDHIVELMEITMRNLLSAGDIDLHDFLARADLLATAGKTVLISDYFEYYRLAAYLTRYTHQPIAITMGAASLYDLLNQATGVHTTGSLDEIPADMRALYQHLLERGRIKSLDNFDRSVLHIFSREVLKRIKDHSAPWEDMVPHEIAEVIKKRHFFGYHEPRVHEEVHSK